MDENSEQSNISEQSDEQNNHKAKSVTLKEYINNIGFYFLTPFILALIMSFGYELVYSKDELGRITITLGKDSEEREQIIQSAQFSRHWIAAEIVGFGYGLYTHRSKLKGSSIMTPLVYTTNTNPDFATLKNIDREKQEKRIDKRESQTHQSILMRRSYFRDPVCLDVYGFRDNNISEYFNIIEIKEWPSNVKEDASVKDFNEKNEICTSEHGQIR